ncbi:hypothetical protein MHYP_G00218900 [Metynnis hypsauchen]
MPHFPHRYIPARKKPLIQTLPQRPKTVRNALPPFLSEGWYVIVVIVLHPRAQISAVFVFRWSGVNDRSGPGPEW